MSRLLYSFLFLMIIGFSSCETDIDINAEYADIPVVYGAINPSDSVHYIKINKAFLGSTSALDLAADANNFNYPAGELIVTIDEHGQNGSFVKSSTLTRTVNEVPKDPGIFDNNTNVLYKFVETSINRDGMYKLKIVNTVLDKEITAETEIVNNYVMSNPVSKGQKFSFWIGNLSTGTPNDRVIGVTTGKDIGRMAAKFIFNYYDFYTLASGKDSVLRSVEMPLGESITTTILGAELLEWDIKAETFFDNIASAVPDKTSDISHRMLHNISLEFDVAGNELSTFMSVSAPSNTVNQDKPNYTNVTNGIGIFSSREKEVWLSSIDPWSSNNINIQNSTITYLATHSELFNKGFCFGTLGVGNPVAPCTQQ